MSRLIGVFEGLYRVKQGCLSFFRLLTILALALVPTWQLQAAGGHSGGGSGGGHGGEHAGGASGFRGGNFGTLGRRVTPGAVTRGAIDPMARAFSATRFDHRHHGHFHQRFNNAGSSGFFFDSPYYPYYGDPYGYGGYGYSQQYYDVPMDYPDTYSSSEAISVRDIQSELAQRGYYTGPIDGIMGPITRQAITDYQRDHDLRASGQVTPALLGRLGLR